MCRCVYMQTSHMLYGCRSTAYQKRYQLFILVTGRTGKTYIFFFGFFAITCYYKIFNIVFGVIQ